MAKEDTKYIMTAITDTTIRGVIKLANQEEIKKEDVVSLVNENGQYVLIYFKRVN